MKDAIGVKGKALHLGYSNINWLLPSYAFYLNHFISFSLPGIICIAGNSLHLDSTLL